MEKVRRINCLTNDMDALYHQAARIFGIADSLLIVLYSILELGDECLLSAVCSESGLTKQTINSALRKLEADEILFLTREKGNSKRIHLTEKGRCVVSQTAERLYQAECSAFHDWTDEEFDRYLNLGEKYKQSLQREINKMKGNTV